MIAFVSLVAVPIGQPREIGIISRGLPKAETKVKIVSPSNQVIDVPTTATGDGAKATFALLEPGPHQVHVSYAGVPVKDSPFRVDALLGPPKVKAYGPGLSGGEANKPAVFTIDTREEKIPGSLGLTVEGPAESPIQCKDNKDGTCEVTYVPPVAGNYKVNILYGDRPIPGSPFRANIKPGKPSIDVSGIRAYGPGLNPAGKPCVQPYIAWIECINY